MRDQKTKIIEDFHYERCQIIGQNKILINSTIITKKIIFEAKLSYNSYPNSEFLQFDLYRPTSAKQVFQLQVAYLHNILIINQSTIILKIH